VAAGQFPALEGADDKDLLARIADLVGVDAGFAGVVPAFHRRRFIQQDEGERERYVDVGLRGLVVVVDESLVAFPVVPAGAGIGAAGVRVAA